MVKHTSTTPTEERHTMTTTTRPLARPVLAATALLLAVLAADAGLGAGTASARPAEAPRLAIAGDDIWTVGNHDNCRGPIRVSAKTDPRQPGKLFVTYRPGRFTGDGPGWARNPVCTTRVFANWTIPARYHWSAPVSAGPRGGKPVTQVLRTGAGLHGIGFATPAVPQKPVQYTLFVS